MHAKDPTRSIPLRGLVLVAGPLVTLLARTLSVPWDDSGMPGARRVVHGFATHPARADAGAALVMVGALLLVLTSLVMALHLGVTKPRTAITSGFLILTGCAGVIGRGAMSVATGQLVKHAPPDIAAGVVSHLTVDALSIDVLMLLGVLGWLILGFSLYRSGRLPRTASVLIGLGGLWTTFTAAGPLLALNLGTTALLLAGAVQTAIFLSKRDHAIAIGADHADARFEDTVATGV